jgi:hypothetical protein
VFFQAQGQRLRHTECPNGKEYQDGKGAGRNAEQTDSSAGARSIFCLQNTEGTKSVLILHPCDSSKLQSRQ